MERIKIITAAEQFAKDELSSDFSGHDWWHVHRVRNAAVMLARAEGADEFIVELTALLHDIKDYKISGSHTAGSEAAQKFCDEQSLPHEVGQEVAFIISAMSFKGAGVQDTPLSLEGQCVRDADRLDAIGAVGIGRAFAFSGSRQRLMWNPEIEPRFHATEQEYRNDAGTTIDHFYEKLLLVKDRITTKTAQGIAEKRHEFMVSFLQEFKGEWHGKL